MDEKIVLLLVITQNVREFYALTLARKEKMLTISVYNV